MKKTKYVPSSINGYIIEQFIGKGAYGIVFTARKIITNTQFAIKIIPKSKIKSEKEIQRFMQEVKTLSTFKCSSIVQMHDFFDDLLNYYLVLDLCEGGELYDYLIVNDKVSERTAATIFKQIVTAIKYSHDHNIAHRDIKLQNILITQFPLVKVCDFGLCGFMKNDNELFSSFCGSTQYLAPECLKREDYDGKKSDIWSMGIVLYTMLVGKPPWEGTSLPLLLKKMLTEKIEFPPTISKECKNLLSIMLATNPLQRATMDEIVNHPWLKHVIIPELSIPKPEPPHSCSRQMLSNRSNLPHQFSEEVLQKCTQATTTRSCPPHVAAAIVVLRKSIRGKSVALNRGSTEIRGKHVEQSGNRYLSRTPEHFI